MTNDDPIEKEIIEKEKLFMEESDLKNEDEPQNRTKMMAAIFMMTSVLFGIVKMIMSIIN